MKCSDQPTLRQRVQALPQELQDWILDEVFTSGPGVIVIPATTNITRTDCQFPPPGLLRVSRATREAIVWSYYCGTTFVILAQEWEHLEYLFGRRLGYVHSDPAGCQEHGTFVDECGHCPYVVRVESYLTKASKKWKTCGWKTAVTVDHYANPSELCDQLDEEGIHVRHFGSLSFTTVKQKWAGGRVVLSVEDIMNENFIHDMFKSG